MPCPFRMRRAVLPRTADNNIPGSNIFRSSPVCACWWWLAFWTISPGATRQHLDLSYKWPKALLFNQCLDMVMVPGSRKYKNPGRNNVFTVSNPELLGPRHDPRAWIWWAPFSPALTTLAMWGNPRGRRSVPYDRINNWMSSSTVISHMAHVLVTTTRYVTIWVGQLLFDYYISV